MLRPVRIIAVNGIRNVLLCPSFKSLLEEFGLGSAQHGNNFFTDRHKVAAGVCWLELHHCFSHSIKVRGLLQYVYVGLWEYVLIFKKLFPTSAQWLSQLKNLGGTKMFGFRRITLFCLEKRLSKHKITIFSKHLGGMAPLTPPGYAYASA